MKHFSAYRLVLSAMFAALVCVATMLVRIPMPATGGYANLGDGVILIGAFMLSPVHAASAAGVGSLLADLLAGYASFAPGTLIIKGGMALAAALIYGRLSGKGEKAGMAMGAVVAGAIMVLGYFVYESLILGMGMAAAASIPGNIGQAVVGILAGLIVTPLLRKSQELKELSDRAKK